MKTLSVSCRRSTIFINHDAAFCSSLKSICYGSNEKDDGCDADGVGVISRSV